MTMIMVSWNMTWQVTETTFDIRLHLWDLQLQHWGNHSHSSSHRLCYYRLLSLHRLLLLLHRQSLWRWVQLDLGPKTSLRMTDWLSFGSGGGGSIQIPQLPILPPPSSLGAGSGSPFILPDFSPCPQVGDTNWVWVIIYTPGQNGNHPSVCVPHDYSTTTLVDSFL